MSDLQQRQYYKIHTGTNQEDGYDKIYLGYQSQNTEILLKKDQTTYFHIPYFTETTSISSTTLIQDGAIPGPIPALADRIYKKTGNYGNNTYFGSSKQTYNGEWLCSWLYSNNENAPVWLDRYFNPGRITYEEALEGKANFEDYISNEPIYYDTLSRLNLEPGTWFRFDHMGENTMAAIVSSFSGTNKEHLRLNIENWSADFIENSIYSNEIQINNFKLNWIKEILEPNYLDRSALSFENNDFIDAKVVYNDKYFLNNEFSLLFWFKNNDWSTATTTQLLGNYNSDGFGCFYNNLKNYPFFVISENTYGHLFYFNPEYLGYYDKNTQIIPGQAPVTPYVSINEFSDVYVINSKNRKIFKYNHLGTLTGQTILSSGARFTLIAKPELLLIDKDNNVIVPTLSGTYTFDQNLVFKKFDELTPHIPNEVRVFDINGNIVNEPNCIDVKFDSKNNKWVLSNNKKLYCNGSLIKEFEGDGTNIIIDPEDNLWLLYNNNKIDKFNTTTKTKITTFEVGTSQTEIGAKNISFIYQNNRTTNTQQWYGVIVHDYEKTMYQVTLDGDIVKRVFLPDKLNIFDSLLANQNPNLLTFTTKGDFTGYEWQRIFNNVKYQNKPQFQIKIAFKSSINNLPNIHKIYSIPTNFIADRVWDLASIVLKNTELTVYINGAKAKTFYLPKGYTIDYTLKNNLYIGCPCGESENLNNEINSKSIIWNGYIDSIKIYDYAISQDLFKYFLYAKTVAKDIIWNIPTSKLQYIEGIDRFFKHRVPGFKSPFFRVKIVNSQITDPEVQNLIQDSIEEAIEQIKPVYTELLSIDWVN